MADRRTQQTAGLTVKQQRDARRAEKVAALKQQQQRSKRNRLIAILGGAVAAAAVLALVIVLVVVNSTPTVKAPAEAFDGERTWDDLPSTHVSTQVDYQEKYDMLPPAGGDHAAAWLNCGVYEEVVPEVNAVHSLEHGAVWVTYDADALDADELDALRASVPATYTIVSPYEGLATPITLSAWGVQLQLEELDQAKIDDFLEKYWQSPDAPEPGASCSGALDGPGKVS
jgi:hypothetical protein